MVGSRWCLTPTSQGAKDLLKDMFIEHVIGLGFDMEWPPRSPYLTPSENLLWGYLKNKVFATPHANVAEMTERIRVETDNLRQNCDMI